MACGILAGGIFAGSATQAQTASLSTGCLLAPSIGGVNGAAIPSAIASNFPFDSGETLVVTFSQPAQGATIGALTVGQGSSMTGVSSQSTAVAGSLSYTFQATGTYSLKASVDLGLAVMGFSCSASNDTDLALSAAPPDIITDATSSAGATVSYTAPTAADEEGPPPVECDQASGSTFPIGTTTVTCTVTDPDDTPGTVSASFTVTVSGAADQLDQLEAAVVGVGPGTSLFDKIEATEGDLAGGTVGAACDELGGFVGEATAQEGKSITGGATGLSASARQIRAVLGCPSD
jgi:hypothetical protein